MAKSGRKKEFGAARIEVARRLYHLAHAWALRGLTPAADQLALRAVRKLFNVPELERVMDRVRKDDADVPKPLATAFKVFHGKAPGNGKGAAQREPAHYAEMKIVIAKVLNHTLREIVFEGVTLKEGWRNLQAAEGFIRFDALAGAVRRLKKYPDHGEPDYVGAVTDALEEMRKGDREPGGGGDYTGARILAFFLQRGMTTRAERAAGVEIADRQFHLITGGVIKAYEKGEAARPKKIRRRLAKAAPAPETA